MDSTSSRKHSDLQSGPGGPRSLGGSRISRLFSEVFERVSQGFWLGAKWTEKIQRREEQKRKSPEKKRLMGLCCFQVQRVRGERPDSLRASSQTTRRNIRELTRVPVQRRHVPGETGSDLHLQVQRRRHIRLRVEGEDSGDLMMTRTEECLIFRETLNEGMKQDNEKYCQFNV